MMQNLYSSENWTSMKLFTSDYLYPLAPVKIQLEKCHRQYPKMLISREHTQQKFCWPVLFWYLLHRIVWWRMILCNKKRVTTIFLCYLHSVNGHKTNSQKNPKPGIPPGVCEVINTVHYKIQQNNFKDFAKVYSFV